MRKTWTFILFALLICSMAPIVAADCDNWEDTDFAKRKAITINTSGMSGSLTNHTVLFTLDTAALIAAGSMQADCDDLKFMNGTDVLGYSFKNLTSTAYGCNTSQTKIHILIPITGNDNTTEICMYYDDDDGSSQADTEDVWDDNFIAIYTFYEESGSTLHDVKGSFDFTISGAAWNSTYPFSDNGYGLDFQPNDYMTQGTLMDGGATDGAIFMFFYRYAQPVASNEHLIDKGGAAIHDVYYGDENQLVVRNAGQNVVDDPDGPVDEWFLFTDVWGSTRGLELWIGDTQIGNDDADTNAWPADTGQDFWVGRSYDGNEYMYGILGFMAVYTTTISDDMIRAMSGLEDGTYVYLTQGDEKELGAGSVDIFSPADGSTYYSSSIALNVDNETDMDTFLYSLDGAANVTFTPNTTITAYGGSHTLVVYSNDTAGDWFDDSVSFSVLFTLNVSIYDNSTHDALTNWDMLITNGSDNNFTTDLNNTVIFDVTTLPQGNVNITLSDGDPGLYYINRTFAYNINNTIGINLSAELGEKDNNTVTLSASPGWIITENTPTTITCTALDGTSDFTRDGIVISSPYSFSGSLGTYVFNCSAIETANYKPAYEVQILSVSIGGFGCTNSETYAFSMVINATTNWTFLNFTGQVNSSYVKSDLSDVWGSENVSIYTNLTDGYYVVINATYHMNFTLYWGNYFINYTYTEEDLVDNETNVSGVTEENPYYVLTIYEEMTRLEQLPPDTNQTVVILYCANGTTSMNVSDTQFIVAAFETLDEIVFRVQYSAGDIYLRSYEVESSVEYRDIYLTDAANYQVVQLIMSLADNTGDFGSSILRLKKPLGSGEATITERRWDAEKKVIIYLIDNEKYNIYIDNDEEERVIGYLYVDSTDLTKTLTIGEILTLNRTVGNISYSLYNTSTSIVFSYLDPAHQTIAINFTVYNVSNDAILYNASSSNSSIVEFTYVFLDSTWDYKAVAEVHHSFYGEDTFTLSQIFPFGSLLLVPPFPLALPTAFIGTISIGWQNLVMVVTMVTGVLTFGALSAPIGIIFMVLLGMLFVFWGWWDASMAFLIAALVLAIINQMVKRRKVT